MTLEHDITEIKGRIEGIENRQREISKNMLGCGTILLLGIAMIASVKSCENTQEILDRLNKAPYVQVQKTQSRDYKRSESVEDYIKKGGRMPIR